MPHDELLISTPAQVRALASGVRAAMVESLLVLGPSPLRDVATRLGRSPESLYHHAGILERAGIIRVSQVRRAGRTRQRVYALVATRLRLDRSRRTPAMRRARAGAATAMLGAASRRARAAIAAGLDEGPPRAKRARVETLMIDLSAEDLAGLHARVDDLWAFLGACRDRPAGRSRVATTRPLAQAVTIVIAPAGVVPGRAGLARTPRGDDTRTPRLPTTSRRTR